LGKEPGSLFFSPFGPFFFLTIATLGFLTAALFPSFFLTERLSPVQAVLSPFSLGCPYTMWRISSMGRPHFFFFLFVNRGFLGPPILPPPPLSWEGVLSPESSLVAVAGCLFPWTGCFSFFSFLGTVSPSCPVTPCPRLEIHVNS